MNRPKSSPSKSSPILSSNSSKNTPEPNHNLDFINIKIKCKNENQKKFLKLMDEKEIVIAAGYAGTGKTYLACAKALQLLKEGKYKKIVLIKSVTTLKNEEVGFLSGTFSDKLSLPMLSYIYNFYDLIGEQNTNFLIENGYIQMLGLSYLRGLSISNSIILADEMQNVSYDNCKTLLTRISYNTVCFLMGDEKQIDLRNKRESALSFICDKFENIHNKIGTIRFTKDDIVRNELIKIIEDVFDTI